MAISIRGFSNLTLYNKELLFREIQFSHLKSKSDILLNGPLWKLYKESLFFYNEKRVWQKRSSIQARHDQGAVLVGKSAFYEALKQNVKTEFFKYKQRGLAAPDYLGWVSRDEKDLYFKNPEKRALLKDFSMEDGCRILGDRAFELSREYINLEECKSFFR